MPETNDKTERQHRIDALMAEFEEHGEKIRLTEACRAIRLLRFKTIFIIVAAVSSFLCFTAWAVFNAEASKIALRKTEVEKAGLQNKIELLLSDSTSTMVDEEGSHGIDEGAGKQPNELPGMVWIEPGGFTMGDDGEPRHRVVLTKGFYLGEYEVTQAEFVKYMGGDNPSEFKQPKSPVEKVSWHDAIRFCNFRSDLERLPRYYDTRSADPIILGGPGYRLPTEAEWEYACRAGTATSYSFGDDESLLGRYAWYNGDKEDRTHEVGRKQPNAWGLYDMHGNVSEWCWDYYRAYSNRPEEDPTGPHSGKNRVIRGGSWLNSADNLRSARRNLIEPDEVQNYIGFRVARSKDEAAAPASFD